ncbi:hypothetical protein TNCV_2574961 [Trichonephila clavipes]|nr:hypothetical protein TNCV_2574961 [Trichonephila clavipes]
MSKQPALDAYDRGQIVRCAMLGPFHFRNRPTSRIFKVISVEINKWTVQRSLHQMGFGSRRPTRVSLLSARHRSARLAWAKEHRDKKRVAWSDVSPSDYLTSMGD